ncbi:MAG: TldD/PmbA family protein [Tannerella sp.]|jgi:PmbA protein|nr:TldD/PmbA family protein [Tannerella sp.]
MITNEQKDLARWAMEFALQNGCQSASLSLYNNSNASFEIRDMKIDSLQQATENGLSIQLFVDGRFGAISTNRLDKNELKQFIKNGIESTRYLAEDKARTLPDASLYYKGGGVDLQLYDNKFGNIQPDDKVALALKVCDEIMDKDKRIVSSGSSYSDGDSFSYRINSNGFEGESSNSYYSLAGMASIKDEGDARPSSYWFELSLFYDELKKDGIGVKALERALSKLGQKKIDSAKLPMVVDFMNSARLLSPVIDAIYGSAIQQKNSFLINKKGEKVFGDKMTLIDEPHLIKASGARYFDNEGIATKKMNVFDAGMLNTYYIDTYYANKLNTPQTISSPSILTMPPGTKNMDGLISSVDKGILVTGFNGGNCNPTTGDFSYGIEGFLIENGKTTQPLNEMNITGNMISLWGNLADTGNDARKTSSWRIPSLLFDNVNFSGT